MFHKILMKFLVWIMVSNLWIETFIHSYFNIKYSVTKRRFISEMNDSYFWRMWNQTNIFVCHSFTFSQSHSKRALYPLSNYYIIVWILFEMKGEVFVYAKKTKYMAFYSSNPLTQWNMVVLNFGNKKKYKYCYGFCV